MSNCGSGANGKGVFSAFLCLPAFGHFLEESSLVSPPFPCGLTDLPSLDCFHSSLGFSFDLSPLTKKNGDYKVETEKYDFYINVCGAVSTASCQPTAGACQVAKRQVTVFSCGFVLCILC